MHKIKRMFLPLMVGIIIVPACVAVPNNPECDLHRYLERKRSCSAMVRPFVKDGLPLSVHLDIQLISITAIEETSQMFKGTLWLEARWKDESLLWDSMVYRGIDTIVLPMKSIWTPDICFMNEITNDKCLKAKEDDRVRVSLNGTITLWTAKEVNLQCNIDIKKYPFDVQNCSIKLGMWYSVDEKVRLKALVPFVKLDNYHANGEWEILKSAVGTYKQNVVGNFTDIHYQIMVRRLPLFYVYYVIFPVILLSCLNILCFSLPIESGEKVSLAMTIFLSLAVFMSVISNSVPKQSKHQFQLGIYLTVELIMSGVTTAMEIFVVRVYYRKKERPLGCFYRKLLPKSKTNNELRICKTTSFHETENSNKMHEKSDNGNYNPCSFSGKFNAESGTNPWEILAMRLDKVFGFAVGVVNVFSIVLYFYFTLRDDN